MIGELNCVECFMREGQHRTADFVCNGQSVCQRHVHVVVADRGDTARLYVWDEGNPDIDAEPVIESVRPNEEP